MEYTTASLATVKSGLGEIARDAQATFGGLDARQLNWRPDATRWSVAQCFDHMLTANRLMFQAAEDALNGAAPRTLWQRVPVLPGLFGRLLIRSQAPGSTGKYTAPPKAQPATSDVASDIVQRFVQQQQAAMAQVETLNEREAARAIMTSPFFSMVTYSVLDGWRLVFAHTRRHVEQARGVTQSRGFPRSEPLE